MLLRDNLNFMLVGSHSRLVAASTGISWRGVCILKGIFSNLANPRDTQRSHQCSITMATLRPNMAHLGRLCISARPLIGVDSSRALFQPVFQASYATASKS